MTTTMRVSKGAHALDAWLEELPALAAALDTDPDARRLLLLDAAGDEALIDKAGKAHPVLLARGHLAHGAIQLLLSEVDDDPEHAEQAVRHAEQAVEIGTALAAPGPRLVILPQAGAVAAAAMGRLRATRRRAVQHLLTDIAEQTAEAYAAQAALSRQGVTALTAALALAEGSKVVRGKARIAVLSRAMELAIDARTDLARAGEVAKAALASQTITTLEAKLA